MAAEIVQSVSRSNSERRYLPSRYILDCRNNPFSKSRSLLQRKREAGSGKNRRGFLLRDKSGYRCRYQMYSAQDDEVISFPRLPSPKGIALSEAILCTRMRTTAQIPAPILGFTKPCVVVFSSNRRSVSYFYSIMHTPLRYENYWL